MTFCASVIFYLHLCPSRVFECHLSPNSIIEGGSRISDWPRVEANRSVKTNTQTFIKFTLRHCCSRGRHCQTVALPDQNSGTAVPTDNFESEFEISE